MLVYIITSTMHGMNDVKTAWRCSSNGPKRARTARAADRLPTSELRPTERDSWKLFWEVTLCPWMLLEVWKDRGVCIIHTEAVHEEMTACSSSSSVNSRQEIFAAVCQENYLFSYFSSTSAAITYSKRTLLRLRSPTTRAGLFAGHHLFLKRWARLTLSVPGNFGCYSIAT
jgi:hypothetical protein